MESLFYVNSKTQFLEPWEVQGNLIFILKEASAFTAAEKVRKITVLQSGHSKLFFCKLTLFNNLSYIFEPGYLFLPFPRASSTAWQLKLALKNANVKEDTPDTTNGRRKVEAKKVFTSTKHLPAWISVAWRVRFKERFCC